MTSIPTQSFWFGKKVLVTGGHGLLGTALVEVLKETGAEVFAPTRKEADWTDWKSTNAYFDKFNPVSQMPESELACVFHLAAKVGGVFANTEKVGDFFSDNIEINNNVLKAAMCNDVERVVSVLSTCVYPDADYVHYPLSEDQLHNGPPHVSNFGYAYAKRMLDVQSRAYNKQYDRKYITVIPNNMFGEHDNFNIDYGHVIPALIHKIWKAKLENKPDVEIWGDGSALREFTYARDAARIMVMLAETYNDPEAINIGCTQEHSIGTVATILAKKLDYHGELVFNTNKPSGQYRKPSTNKKLLERTVWDDDDYTSFDMALENTCLWFMKHYPNVRK